jgi:hypothetical protein
MESPLGYLEDVLPEDGDPMLAAGDAAPRACPLCGARLDGAEELCRMCAEMPA